MLKPLGNYMTAYLHCLTDQLLCCFTNIVYEYFNSVSEDTTVCGILYASVKNFYLYQGGQFKYNVGKQSTQRKRPTFIIVVNVPNLIPQC